VLKLDRPQQDVSPLGITHAAMGSSLRALQEQVMEVAFRALKRHSVVSEYTAVQLKRCLWDQMELRLGRVFALRQLLFAACSTFTKSSGVCMRDSLQGSLTGSRMFWQRVSNGSFPGRS
jgi:hypothetical protein